jgi:hypothetical protein
VISPEAGQALAASCKLEEILLSQGTITPEQLNEALTMQREDRREIGQVLLSLG